MCAVFFAVPNFESLHEGPPSRGGELARVSKDTCLLPVFAGTRKLASPSCALMDDLVFLSACRVSATKTKHTGVRRVRYTRSPESCDAIHGAPESRIFFFFLSFLVSF